MQTVVVALIVVAAVLYVGRRAWRTMAAGKRSDDASCDKCH